jgi:photosystem II stability/assembly factor-like uncharacterized protein
VWALVAGTHLFRSTDRGATWQERALPSTAQIVDMAFINDREGWIVVVGPALCEPQAITTYHTADGAATWDAGSAPSDNSCKGGLFFADAQRGWLTTFSTAAAPSFLRTADGGKTWTRSSPLADPPGFTTQPGGFTLRPGRVRAFGSELLVWAIGQSQTGGTGFVFRSTDEGATWKHLSTAPQAFGAVVFITATRWIQLLDAPNTGETTDAGRSWHPLATDYQQARAGRARGRVRRRFGRLRDGPRKHPAHDRWRRALERDQDTRDLGWPAGEALDECTRPHRSGT